MKKFLNLDFVMTALFMLLVMVASVSFVIVSYDESLCNPEWLCKAMRVIGFISTIVFPVVFWDVLKEYCEQWYDVDELFDHVMGEEDER